MLRLLWTAMLAAVAAIQAAGQSAREELAANPALAAGKYYAYEAPRVIQTAPPAGYEPFYISVFARHGSRYLTDAEKYDRPIAALKQAAAQGCLSADGQRALRAAQALKDEAQGRYGELTPKGAAQHRGLVRRMVEYYPSVFGDGVHVDARSTYKTRAFLSMASACVELARLRPVLRITQDASQHDAYYMKYKNKAYEAEHLGNAGAVYRAADSVYVHPQRLMGQLFTDTAVLSQLSRTPQELMLDLFELYGIAQSSYAPHDLSFLFTPEERYALWQRNNFEWYYEKGASPASGGHMYWLERNLLENFVLTADTVIASGNRAVTLRYGHDTNLAPLAALMGLDRLQVSTADWDAIADTYRTYRIIPMCGNVQLVFYRKAGSDDILLRVLLNEREAKLPVPTDVAPFYHWKDVRAYWQKVLSAIRLPEPSAGQTED